MTASAEVARLARVFAQDEWRKALPDLVQAIREDEKVIAGGMAEWARGSAAKASDFSYYLVTNRGLHFGVKEGSGGFFGSTSYRNEFVPRGSIASVQYDGMQALEFDGGDGHSIAMICFLRDGLQYSDHDMVGKTAAEQASVVAEALGHTFD